MREIKFRGIIKGSNNFAFGDYSYTKGNHIITSEDHSDNADSYYYDEIIGETLGQFTGLKDKNGKEIYEGDIIPMKFSSNQGQGQGIRFGSDYTLNGVVKFDDSFQLRYIIEFPENKHNIISCEFGWGAMTELEVIGNIHEAKELPKDTKNQR